MVLGHAAPDRDTAILDATMVCSQPLLRSQHTIPTHWSPEVSSLRRAAFGSQIMGAFMQLGFNNRYLARVFPKFAAHSFVDLLGGR